MASIADLEVWLTGTRAQLDSARAALGSVGRTAYESDTWRLFGPDAGRHRQYIRIVVTATRKTPHNGEGVTPPWPSAA